MPLKVDQLGIEFSVGPAAKSSSAAHNVDLCCDEEEEHARRQEDRLVERVTERVLAAIKAGQER